MNPKTVPIGPIADEMPKETRALPPEGDGPLPAKTQYVESLPLPIRFHRGLKTYTIKSCRLL